MDGGKEHQILTAEMRVERMPLKGRVVTEIPLDLLGSPQRFLCLNDSQRSTNSA